MRSNEKNSRPWFASVHFARGKYFGGLYTLNGEGSLDQKMSELATISISI
ncbi:MAG: hypothetical protein IJ193_08055 [Bacilli bacterium]|nr:hypothetical protein [Bacilli bacterium]